MTESQQILFLTQPAHGADCRSMLLALVQRLVVEQHAWCAERVSILERGESTTARGADMRRYVGTPGSREALQHARGVQMELLAFDALVADFTPAAGLDVIPDARLIELYGRLVLSLRASWMPDPQA